MVYASKVNRMGIEWNRGVLCLFFLRAEVWLLGYWKL